MLFCVLLKIFDQLDQLSNLALLQSAVTKLLEEICHILPPKYKDQCEAVIDKFTKTVLDAILSYATPQNICALMHMCNRLEAPVVGQSASPSVLQHWALVRFISFPRLASLLSLGNYMF